MIRMVLFFAAFTYASYTCYHQAATIPDEQDCGFILGVHTEYETHKHDVVTSEDYWAIRYDDGTIGAKYPSLQDLYTFKVGDRVCYTKPNGWKDLLEFLFVVSGLTGVALCLMVLREIVLILGKY